MTQLEPFLLTPVFSPRPWGGERLAGYGKDVPGGTVVGESWELADLPDGVAKGMSDPRSRVANGPFIGLTLADLIRSHGRELLGEAEPTPEGRFPLLVKLIDAREPLSVQVHPPEEYVAEHPSARLKTESWYVVDADAGSELFVDISAGASDEELSAAVGTQSVVSLLESIGVGPGFFHHVPAGLVHAVGAGVLLAEVQTPSDTTFRMYDWSVELGRAPREMHLEESRESIRREPPEAFALPAETGPGTRDLITCEHYWMREHRSPEGAMDLRDTAGPRIIIPVVGEATIGDLIVPTCSTAVIPAAARATEVTATDGAVVLEVGLV